MRGFLILATILPAWADQSAAHREGTTLAQTHMGQVQGHARGGVAPGTLPTVQGPAMPSVSADTISALTSAVAGTHEGAQSIRESQSKRAHFTMDPATDPLVANGEGAVRDPHKTMTLAVVQQPGGANGYTYVACDEAGEDYSGACTLRFQPRIVKTYGRVFLHQYVSGHSAERRGYYNDVVGWKHDYAHNRGEDIYHEQWQSGCNVHHTTRENVYAYHTQSRSTNEDGTPALGPKESIDKPTYSAQKEKEEVLQEEAELSDCAGYEALADRGRCHYVGQECLEGPETRTIAGVPIHRSCSGLIAASMPASNPLWRDVPPFGLKDACR